MSYGYDRAANRNSTQWPDSYAVSYTYDALHRMTDVQEGSSSGPSLAHFDRSNARLKRGGCATLLCVVAIMVGGFLARRDAPFGTEVDVGLVCVRSL